MDLILFAKTSVWKQVYLYLYSITFTFFIYLYTDMYSNSDVNWLCVPVFSDINRATFNALQSYNQCM